MELIGNTSTQKEPFDARALLLSLRSQYRAAMGMLKSAVELCPPELWNAAQDKNKFWQIAYHVLFYVHLYDHESIQAFQPWVKHRNEYEQMGPPPWDPTHVPEIGEPYNREEVLEFWEACSSHLEETILKVNLGARSGFDWLPFSKFELYLYNLRHLEQHTGELMERLGSRAGISVDWRSAQP